MLVDIPEPFVPTAKVINSLPEGLRRYIMHLETRSDPAGDTQRIWLLREQVAALEALVCQSGCFADSAVKATAD